MALVGPGAGQVVLGGLRLAMLVEDAEVLDDAANSPP